MNVLTVYESPSRDAEVVLCRITASSHLKSGIVIGAVSRLRCILVTALMQRASLISIQIIVFACGPL